MDVTGAARVRPAAVIGIALAALVAVALLAEPAGAAGRRARPPLPDIAISATSFSPQYVFKGEPASRLRFCDRTTNLGRGSTRRRLHNTMSLRGPDGVRHIVARRDAPKLPGARPRTRTRPVRRFSHAGCGRGEGTINLPPGAYDVVLCADPRLTESNDANNCVSYRRSLFVAKRTWSGTASGNGFFDINLVPQAESWIASGLVYTFDPSQYRRGVFTYVLTAGNVSWKTAASANGCDRTGAAVDGSPTGKVVVNYVDNWYTALGNKNPAFTYVVTDSCNPDDPRSGPTHPIFVDSGIGAPPRPLPFGTEQIADTRTEDDGTVLIWNLQ
jgi:hypothetical protein